MQEQPVHQAVLRVLQLRVLLRGLRLHRLPQQRGPQAGGRGRDRDDKDQEARRLRDKGRDSPADGQGVQVHQHELQEELLRLLPRRRSLRRALQMRQLQEL